MDTPFGFGAIHTTDSRDHIYDAKIGVPEALPTSYSTDTSMFPVLNQGKRSSCVSHAWVRLLQIWWYKKTGKVVNFSPRFLHAITAPGMADSDGRDPRVIGQILTDVGCCTTDLLPNDITLNDHDYSRAEITQAMRDEAARYKIPAYEWPDADQYSIRHAIYHKGAVALLFHVGKEWWTAPINPLRAPQVTVGGHEVAGEHWQGVYDGIENSWDKTWNEAGYAEYNLANYAPLQVLCINDPAVDFNPAPTPFKFLKDLSTGMQNNDVVQLQIRLGVVPTSGWFGPITKAAVIKYQQVHGIPATGYCGPLTRASLNS